MEKIKKQEIWSIPNCMGYFRILLIPVFCVIYLNADSVRDYYLAAGIVLVSTITDLFDGKVARKFNMVTELGKFVDPFADKLTHGAVALCLCTRYKRMIWLVVLMAIKEGFMANYGIDKSPSRQEIRRSKMVRKSMYRNFIYNFRCAGLSTGNSKWNCRCIDFKRNGNYGDCAGFICL